MGDGATEGHPGERDPFSLGLAEMMRMRMGRIRTRRNGELIRERRAERLGGAAARRSSTEYGQGLLGHHEEGGS